MHIFPLDLHQWFSPYIELDAVYQKLLVQNTQENVQ